MAKLSIDEKNTNALEIIKLTLEGFDLLENAELLEALHQQRAILDYATTVTDRGTFDAMVDENLAHIEQCNTVLNEATNNKEDVTPTNALNHYFEHMNAGLSEDTLYKAGKALLERQEGVSLNAQKLSEALAALQPKTSLTETELDGMARENVEHAIKGILMRNGHVFTGDEAVATALVADLQTDLSQRAHLDFGAIEPFNEEMQGSIMQNVIERMLTKIGALTENDVKAVADSLTKDRKGIALPDDFDASKVLQELRATLKASETSNFLAPGFIVDNLKARGRTATPPVGHAQGS